FNILILLTLHNISTIINISKVCIIISNMALSSIQVFCLFLVASIATTTVQVKASRDLPVEIATIEQKLALVGGLMTCLRSCNVNSDCSDAWVCSDCAPSAFPPDYHCDVLTANGQGYYATMLQARNKKQIL
ncbi:hypothetical protein AABB24_029511, partial [Solanum stoloniferum]